MSIQPLPADVAAQIRSSAVITSLNDAVWGLVQNSLDAGASKISISVDYGRGNCSVEDDGLGITPSSFQEGGGLGQLHYTSKYPYQSGTHGRNGVFLASLAALSVLSIASHHRDYRSHNSLTLHSSRIVARNLPAPPEQRVLASPSGTRVVVRDLFGSMPVRVKQRAMEVERAGSSRDFDRLVHNIVALLLPWPSEVTVTVRDSCSRRILSLRALGSVEWSQSYRSTSPDFVSRTSSLLTQAALLEHEDRKTWVPIGATASGISWKGCVSLRPVATKRVQFIALGIQPLLNERHSNFLYEEANRVFDNSSFGIMEECGLDEDRRPTKMEGFTGKELKPKRGVDRWPMFFLQVTLDKATSEIDINDLLEGTDKIISVITDLLQVMIYEFLKKHHFRPRSVNALERLKRPKSNSPALPVQPSVDSIRTPPGGPSMSGTRTSCTKITRRKQTSLPHRSNRTASPGVAPASTSPFTAWLRVKPSTSDARKDTVAPSGAPQQVSVGSPTGRPPNTNKPDLASKTDKPLFDKSGNLIRKPFDEEEEAATSPSISTSSLQQSDAQPSAENTTQRDTVVWIDPTTKIKSLIDPQTGFAIKPQSNLLSKPLPPPTGEEGRKRTARLPNWQLSQSGPRNTIFQTTEPPIPQVIQASEVIGRDYLGRSNEAQDLAGLQPPNGNVTVPLESRISKAALQRAEVLGQVDQKFILAKVAADPSPSPSPSPSQPRPAADSLLVLIDQHAADERCRAEDLLRSYFVPGPATVDHCYVAQTQALDKPLRFDLSRQDGCLLHRYKARFARWGIGYEVWQGQEDGGLGQGQDQDQELPAPRQSTTIQVRSLPPSILERCRLEPRLLIELLRKDAWKLHGGGSGSGSGHGPGRRRPDGDGDGGGGGGRGGGGGEHEWVARLHDCPEGILDLIHSRACRSKSLSIYPLCA
ncbi:hypothetical protein VTK26DRAFT_63 [Humicola hyalothermophila]